MLKCRLSAVGKYTVDDCNYNIHHNELHFNRIAPYHDLIYMIEGEWEIFQDGIPYTISAGDILFLNAKHHHYGIKPCSETVRTMYIHINALPDDGCGISFESSADAFVFPVRMSVPASSPVPAMMENVISSYWSNTLYSAEQSGAYLTLLLSELSLLSRQNGAISEKGILVDKLIRTMRNAPQRFFSVDELCDLVKVSRKTLHNYFVGVTGLSPHEYQIVSKLKEASKSIEDHPELTMEQIALSLGFCDVHHFSKAYKQFFGHTPKRNKR